MVLGWTPRCRPGPHVCPGHGRVHGMQDYDSTHARRGGPDYADRHTHHCPDNRTADNGSIPDRKPRTDGNPYKDRDANPYADGHARS